MFRIKVRPEERYQFTFPQTADQLQIKHGQDISGVGCVQIRLEVFGEQRLYLHLLYLGRDTVVGWVARD